MAIDPLPAEPDVGANWVAYATALHMTVNELVTKTNTWPEQAPPTLPFEDRLGVSFSASGQTATYHAWADGLAAGAVELHTLTAAHT